MRIVNVSGHRILASLGNDTIEATILFENGQTSSASVPAGLSAGKYEVAKSPINKAISECLEISKIVSEKDWDQISLDNELIIHGYGGNSTLAVSTAFWKMENVLAKLKNEEVKVKKLPKLMTLVFEGGKHGNPKISIQEFLIIEESVEGARETFFKVKKFLEEQHIAPLVGAEGAFSPEGFDNYKILDTLKNLLPDKQIALDAADSFEEGSPINYGELLGKYNIVSIEDPFSDEEWNKWTEFKKVWGEKIMVVGDDLTTTNPERIKKAIDLSAINAIIIKPNQIGTISQSINAVDLARAAGMKIIVSHRGEETDDNWIADFALAVSADYVKFGGMDRGERVAKYNRLLEMTSH